MTDIAKFVIQKHTSGDEVHWDLMLQVGSALETYRLQLPPEELLYKKSTAIKIFDHPLKFLTYEGSVNNGKGRVEIAEAGTYNLLSENKDRKELQLDGRALKGRFSLVYVENDRWQFQLAVES